MSEEPKDTLSEEDEVPLRDGRTARFRPAGPGDAELFAGFVEALSAQSRDYMHGWSSIPDAQTQGAQLAARTAAEDHCAIVATCPGPPERIVGYCWVDRLRGPQVPLLGIGVVDEYHEQGLGRLLLRRMLDRAASRGADRVLLGVWSDNARAVHLYRSVGFHEDPEVPPRDFEGRTELYMVVETDR